MTLRDIPRLSDLDGSHTVRGRRAGWEPILLRAPDPLRRVARQWEPAILRRPSVMVLLTAYLTLLFLIPARLVIGGMGAIGRPAIVVALMLAFLWMLGLIQPYGLREGFQPVRWIVGGYVVLQLLGYMVGFDRGLPAIEASSADRWMILTFAMAGIALAIADAVADRDQLDRLLVLVVGLAAVMAAIGALQFLGIVDLVQYIQVPGLRLNSDLIGTSERGGPGFPRVASTATHYIEFGVVLAMVLPLALHYALFATTSRQRMLRWAAVALIGSGIPFSISRSATLSVIVSAIAIASVWTWRHRLNALVIGLVAVVAFRTVQPGLLGTIKALFTNAENDPSVQDRIARTARVIELWHERPWFGRGAGTFIPERYFLLDNQYYGTLLAGGVIGLTGLIAFFLVLYLTSRSLRLRGASEQTRHLAQALAGAFLVVLVSSATFDSLSFGTFTGLLFVLAGAVGALWRLDGGGGGRRPLQAAGPNDRYVASPWMVGWEPARSDSTGHAKPSDGRSDAKPSADVAQGRHRKGPDSLA